MSDADTDFESWAEAYDSQPEVTALQRAVAFDDASIIEVGCGSGRLTQRITPPTQDYLAVDVDREVADPVRELPGVQFALASGEGLPVPDNSFDVVLDGWALSAQDVEQALSEYARVCRSEGTVAILTESWGEAGRPDSDYVQLLREYDPGHRWPDLAESLYTPIETEFDSTTRTPITAGYEFPDVGATIDAFRYHIEEYNNREFPEDARDSMRETLREKYTTSSGSVELTEHATLLVATPAPHSAE